MSKRGLITDDNIDKVLFDRLQVLDLSMCHVSDACLFKLSNSRHNYLRKVDLNSAKDSNESITSAGLTSLSRACPNLQILYLRRCINITDSGVISISENCPFLVELNIGGCPRITDATLISLGQNCRYLRSFNFSKSEVTDCGVLSLVSGTCATCLKEIHMNGCANLTDESVEAVIQFCPQISILLFHGCPHITEHARNALEELMRAESSAVKQITWTVY
ncbi:hypothetical protein C0Q70_10498 [Pomacea canaliculata]|uniref:Protein AMN1 homolog n=1 Tax=Pomacea canaliculata TaxID=400727 RepID=A0A2T7P3F2_POMCA|nr:protein AMN1 homolog [Pomacea canaliculata]PVD27923.1 hypothetical protein C0Q70_10498 [Pomacea canaliculata]